MLEVVIEIDGRPLSSFGCDGVVVSTPTGSTAYNFSAGGPVIWPTVEAIAVVPLSAHALFAKPLVVGPEHAVAIEVLERTNGIGVLWCDGRRSHDLPPGARVVVRRSERPGPPRAAAPRGVHRPARAQVPASRRGMARARRRSTTGVDRAGSVIEEMRLRDLGVIAEATLPIGSGLHRDHRRDRRGQDDGRDGPRPAARPARRLGRRARGRRAGIRRRRLDRAGARRRRRPRARSGRRRRVDRRRPRRAARRTIALQRGPQPRERRRPRGARRRCSPTSPTSSSSCTASPTSCGCAPPPRSATRSTASAAHRSRARWPPTGRRSSTRAR